MSSGCTAKKLLSGMGSESTDWRKGTREALAIAYPPTLLAETVKIVERCDFSLDVLRYEYSEALTPPGKTATQYLREVTFAGLDRRYPQGAQELQLLTELQYGHFVLTVYDIVLFARSRNILYHGRGSAEPDGLPAAFALRARGER